MKAAHTHTQPPHDADMRITTAQRQQAFNGGQSKLDVDKWRLKIEP